MLVNRADSQKSAARFVRRIRGMQDILLGHDLILFHAIKLYLSIVVKYNTAAISL